mgnify:CR=1 FL=1
MGSLHRIVTPVSFATLYTGTFRNQALHLQCDICAAEKPHPSGDEAVDSPATASSEEVGSPSVLEGTAVAGVNTDADADADAAGAGVGAGAGAGAFAGAVSAVQSRRQRRRRSSIAAPTTSQLVCLGGPPPGMMEGEGGPVAVLGTGDEYRTIGLNKPAPPCGNWCFEVSSHKLQRLWVGWMHPAVVKRVGRSFVLGR